MKPVAIFVFAIMLFAGCGQNRSAVKGVLTRIDSLAIANDFEEADSLLSGIRQYDLETDEDKAFYYLLKAHVDAAKSREMANDSMINTSIDYYRRSNEKSKLARAYYYKGIHEYISGRTKNALLLIKEAENVDKKAETPWLRYLIYVNMSFINSSLGANHTALEYARKALRYSIKHDNVLWRCFAYNNIATSYEGLGLKDSAFVYIKKIMPYLDEIDDREDRAGYLTNIGYFYYEEGLYKEAEKLFRQAVALVAAPNPVVNLAKTCYMLGKKQEADSLIKTVWASADVELKAEMLYFLAEKTEEDGEFKLSTDLYKKAKAMQDSVETLKKPEEAISLQHKFEQKEYEQETNRRELASLAIGIVVVVMLLSAFFIYYRKKINKAKKIIDDNNRKIDEYSKRIESLEKSDLRHSNAALVLERKIRKLKDEQNAVISRGQNLYNDIVAGGTTATWKKKEFDEFIEFYRVSRPQAVADAENNYKRLSSTNIFYLLLVDMSHNETDMQRIMCMNPGAMRTMKSRIKAKKVV